MIYGTVNEKGTPNMFTIPVKRANLQYALKKKPITLNAPFNMSFDQLVWEEVDFTFDIDADAFKVERPLVDGAVEELVRVITKTVTDYKLRFS